MKKNKLFFSAAFFVLTFGLLSVASSNAQIKSLTQESLIVGEWFPLDTSSGGLGMGYTFNADGKLTSVFGAYVAFKYRLEGDTLISIFPGEPEFKHKVEINSTKLIFSDEDPNIELTRVAGSNHSGIIGKWTGDHYTGSKQIINFTNSQNEYLSVPMQTEQGTYEIKSDIVELIGATTSSYQWSVEGDILILIAMDDEKSYKFVRID